MRTSWAKAAIAAVLAAAGVWGASAQGDGAKLTDIEVTTSPKVNVTVRGTGEAGTAYQLQWSEKLGDDADWKHAGDATAKDDGSFAILDEGFRKPGFYRVQCDSSPGRYLVVHMSSGVAEDGWPVTYLDSVPAGGWTDEYKTTNLVLRRIPAGTFVMGSPEGEKGRATNETPHRVTLTRDYYIGVFEITQAQWELVMKTNPSAHKGDTRPVDKVSYNDIRGSDWGANWPSDDNVDYDSFIGRLSTLTGLDFDLPTEAQWEYACRAGTTTALNNGRDLDAVSGTCTNLDSIGRYSGNRSDGKGGFAEHTVVGSYLPNAWGLYDMHGNVSEWCLDWFAPFSGDSAWNPVGPLEPASGYGRVKRGGSWSHPSGSCRSATRFTGSASEASLYAGLRLVCSELRGVQLWKNGPYWAETNLGADNPEDYGLYFWWGDTLGYKWNEDAYAWFASDGSEAKNPFTEETVPTYGLDNSTLLSEGWITADGVLAPDHDAARAHWGGGWRMPTAAEYSALTNHCDCTWTNRNGYKGFQFRGRGDYAQASIFIPAAGWGNSYGFYAPFYDDPTGRYWSSVPHSENAKSSHEFYINEWARAFVSSINYRTYGFPIRPVRDPAKPAHAKVQLWKDGPYWATENIGADNPEDYGLYFWWGDTIGYRREGDAWVASDGSVSNFEFTSENTPTDNKDVATLMNEWWVTDEGVLFPGHDAAQAHWGEEWRVPAKWDLEGLRDNCDWTWTTTNGVNGYVVRGRGDYAEASIFLPAAGFGFLMVLGQEDSQGMIWSSCPKAESSTCSWGIVFGSDDHKVSGDIDRDLGFPVRPIWKPIK